MWKQRVNHIVNNGMNNGNACQRVCFASSASVNFIVDTFMTTRVCCASKCCSRLQCGHIHDTKCMLCFEKVAVSQYQNGYMHANTTQHSVVLCVKELLLFNSIMDTFMTTSARSAFKSCRHFQYGYIHADTCVLCFEVLQSVNQAE